MFVRAAILLLVLAAHNGPRRMCRAERFPRLQAVGTLVGNGCLCGVTMRRPGGQGLEFHCRAAPASPVVLEAAWRDTVSDALLLFIEHVASSIDPEGRLAWAGN